MVGCTGLLPGDLDFSPKRNNATSSLRVWFILLKIMVSRCTCLPADASRLSPWPSRAPRCVMDGAGDRCEARQGLTAKPWARLVLS